MAYMENKNNIKSPLFFYCLLVVIFWTVIFALSLWFNLSETYEHAESDALTQARTALEKDLLYRRWNFEQGGVYVPARPEIEPDLYLTPPDRDLTTTSGLKLTKINSAYMSWLVQELAGLSSHMSSRIVSNMSINPGNKPDAWESKALTRLEGRGAAEVSEVQHVNNIQYLRLVRLMSQEEIQMFCYDFQKEQFGSGVVGISISVPMDPVWATVWKTVTTLSISHICIWLLGIVVFISGTRSLYKREKERDRAEADLITFAEELQDRVAKRSHDVQKRQFELQAFMDNTGALVYLKDTDCKYMMANKSYLKLLGLELDDIIGRTDFEIMAIELADKIRLYEEQILFTQQAVEAEDVFELGGNGSVYGASFFPVLGNKGAMEGIGAMFYDITQRLRLEEDLMNTRDIAENANKAKTYFLANISHEIRTPLNGVLGMADLLAHTRLDSDQASMVSTIKTASSSLLGILNDILDFSKIESDKVVLDPTPFGLRELVFGVVRGLASLADKKQLKLVVHIAPQVPDNLIGDNLRIRQILMNLLSNAIKFTEHGEITITVRLITQEYGYVRLRMSVTDTGIGIPLEKQERIFNAFEQADASTTRLYGGTGLGLAISSRLAKLMGSKLFLESQPGYGSSFWFDLDFPFCEDELLSCSVVPTEFLKGIKVLVAADDTAERCSLVEQLHAWGMESIEASGVDEAMRLLNVSANTLHRFDVVISDLPTPASNEMSLIREMNANSLLSDIPVVVLLSAEAPEEVVSKSVFFTNLTKPIRPVELMRAIASALGIWERFDMSSIQGNKDNDVPRVSKKSLKVLLVEDMEVNQIVASRMLGDLGHEVTIACNGQRALEFLLTEQFDIVLMDIQMPVLDGVQTTLKIREKESHDPAKPHIPIVAMTAHAMESDKERYMGCGMDSYLAKPVLFADLAEVLDDLISRFELVGHELAINLSAPTAEKAASIVDENLSPVDNTTEDISSSLDQDIMCKSFVGNISLAVQSMEVYVRDAPKLLLDIEHAIGNEDNAALAANAHALKGITGYYTKSEPYQACLTLEMMGRCEKLPDDMDQVVKQNIIVKTEINKLIFDMSNFIARHS